MINLSTDSINARTPYKVERIDENSFVFTTNGGVVYSVGFVRDTSFMDYGLYQFFISNIGGKDSAEVIDLNKMFQMNFSYNFDLLKNLIEALMKNQKNLPVHL